MVLAASRTAACSALKSASGISEMTSRSIVEPAIIGVAELKGHRSEQPELLARFIFRRHVARVSRCGSECFRLSRGTLEDPATDESWRLPPVLFDWRITLDWAARSRIRSVSGRDANLEQRNISLSYPSQASSYLNT